MTRPLLARGCSVTAVDNSSEMLVHVPDGAQKICSHIEELSLRRQFDAVLYASNLINTRNGGSTSLLKYYETLTWSGFSRKPASHLCNGSASAGDAQASVRYGSVIDRG